MDASDKLHAKDSVRVTLTKLKQVLARDPPFRVSEADTKAEFIDKYVSALGYQGLEDVVREYYVKNSQEFIDYAVRVGDKVALAIEAKPVQTDLTDKQAAQLVQYCSVEGIEWAALTNARQLRLFNTYLKGGLDQKLVANLDLLGFNSESEFDAIFDQLWLLSKASMSSPSVVHSWMEQRRLDRALRAMLLNPHSDAVKSLVGSLARSWDVHASQEAVVQWLRDHLTGGVSIVPAYVPIKPAPLPKPSVVAEPTGEAYGPQYWLLPAGKAKDGASSVEQLHRWLDRGMWGMHKSTAGRTRLKAGDYVCFYAALTGVVAHARIAGPADQIVSPAEWPEPYPVELPIYRVPLKDVIWLPSPLKIDKTVQSQMDAFAGKRPEGNPGWLVQTTRRLSPHDFAVLTEQRAA